MDAISRESNGISEEWGDLDETERSDEDDFEQMENECGKTPDGGCLYAGTEYCDWVCPLGGKP